ncbi:MAG: hypothetical protein SGJ04_02265 [Bacteroidota bacterium]|nr:hypothetical protein [Bacteroidota bacterium]
MKVLIFTIATAFLITACEKDITTPPKPNETELITTCILTLTDSANASNVVKATFRDPDGEGGNAATQFDSIRLKANTTYNTQIVLLDESKSPADTISKEILKEQNDHQFFFNNTTGLQIIYADKDTNTPSLPVGLSTIWRTTSPSAGTVTVILKHQPGTKKGNQADGDTDIELKYNTVIR